MQADRGSTRAGEDTLRRILKRETRESHDRLDAAMGDWPVDSREGYATFLLTQYRARAPIEGWIARALPNTQAPPAQAPLIARDLAELGLALPHSTAFALPQGAEPIGLVWALAGAALQKSQTQARDRRLMLLMELNRAALRAASPPSLLRLLRVSLLKCL